MPVEDDEGAAIRWDAAYAQGDQTRSWFQQHPEFSLTLLAHAGVTPDDGVIDVGGGAGRLVDALLARGFADLTMLDVSEVGLAHARRRLGLAAGRVTWLVADLLDWVPDRTYRVWHDRAVFHFMTTESDQHRYLRALDAATAIGALAIIGCFAPGGPETCSGLPVARHDPAGIAACLGARWQLVAEDREEHLTPSEAVQPFSWATLKRVN